MENLPLASNYCSTECTALAVSSSISSYQRLYPGTSAAFSVNAPAGAIISWAATPTNLFTVISGSGPSFTTSASGTSGTSIVTLTVAGACAANASLMVLVGTGEPTGTYSYPGGSYLPLQTVNYVTPGEIRLTMDQPYSFTFTSDQANVPVYGSGQLAAFTLQARQGVTITATSPSGSPCGLAGHFTFTTTSGYRLVATPNPASSDLVVTAVDEDQPETSTTPSATAPPFEVELYDSRGKKVKASKSDKGKGLVDVRELPAGLYNVRAGKGKEAISKHIEITH